jgi:hypothetical protein
VFNETGWKKFCTGPAEELLLIRQKGELVRFRIKFSEGKMSRRSHKNNSYHYRCEAAKREDHPSLPNLPGFFPGRPLGGVDHDSHVCPWIYLSDMKRAKTERGTN